MSGDNERRSGVQGAAWIVDETAGPTPRGVADPIAVRTPDPNHPARAKAAGSAGADAARKVPGTRTPSRHGVQGERELVTLYRGLVRDYFLAVVRRQKQQRRSKAFERAVLTGQVIGLFLILGSMVMGLRLARSLQQPREQAAVERWIATNGDDVEVIQWYPTEPAREGDGAIVRVKYRYFSPSRKGIVTDRTFLVRGDQVAVVNDLNPSEDDPDPSISPGSTRGSADRRGKDTIRKVRPGRGDYRTRQAVRRSGD